MNPFLVSNWDVILGAICQFWGGLGYELHGVDLTPMVDTKLPIWLSAQGSRRKALGM